MSTPEEMRKVLELQQERAWNRLSLDIRSAMRGGWSIACEMTAWDIFMTMKVIGPIPWERIPETLLYSGIYNTLRKMAGYAEEDPQQWVGGDSTYPQVFRFASLALRDALDMGDFEAEWVGILQEIREDGGSS